MTLKWRPILFLFCMGILAMLLACGLGAAPMEAPLSAPEEPASEESAPEDSEPSEAALPTPTMSLMGPTALAIATLETKLPTSEIEALQPAITENRRLTLEFPIIMRLGDSTRIRLQLEVDDLGTVTPTAMIEGNIVAGEVIQIPNLYETHNVIAEARLDLAGMLVQPSQAISEPLTQGKPVTYYWSVRPTEAGDYQGSVWLHLRFIPKSGGPESRIPVSVQFIDIQVDSFLGLLSGGAARGFGTVGSIIGTVLGLPFVGDISKWILKRLWGQRKVKA